jgi:hypothetical protein
MARHYDLRNDLFTRQAVLFTVAEQCDGPIAEFGCGFGSTLFLHGIANRCGVNVVTLDSDANWFAQFSGLPGSVIFTPRTMSSGSCRSCRENFNGPSGVGLGARVRCARSMGHIARA